MMILDPFFGIFGFGKFVARWFNRALILLELAAAVWGFKYHCEEIWLSGQIWYKVLYVPACLIAINILNRLIRALWNIVVVFVYGSSNPEDILAHHDAKIENNRRLSEFIAEKRGLRKEKAKERREEKHRKRQQINKKQIEDYLNTPPSQLIGGYGKRRILRRLLSLSARRISF